MRWIMILICLLALGGGVVIAQTATDEPVSPTPTTETSTTAQSLTAEEARRVLQRAQAILDEAAELNAETRDSAQTASELGFNLLGLFEALSFIVTVVGGAAAFFGFTRFMRAQDELEQTRQLVQTEFEQNRQAYEREIRQREAELDQLRSSLEGLAAEERKRTSRALVANALIPLGERQYRAQDYEGALNTYQRTLELDPENPVVHQRIGYVFMQRGDLLQAEHHYEKAIDAEPNFAPALAGLGFVYRRQGEKMPPGIERDRMFNKAESLLLQALELSPKLVDDDGESWWGILGGLYKRRNQVDQAINAYEQATIVTPQSSYGFNNLAQLYMKSGDIDKMRETYRKVERIAAKEADMEQGNFWGYADLIVSRFALGKTQLAAEVLPIAISIAPPSSPYMLQGLKDSLVDLRPVLTTEQQTALDDAVQSIEDAISARSAP